MQKKYQSLNTWRCWSLRKVNCQTCWLSWHEFKLSRTDLRASVMSSTDWKQPANVLCKMYSPPCVETQVLELCTKFTHVASNGFDGRNTFTCRQKCEKYHILYILCSVAAVVWLQDIMSVLFVKSSPMTKNKYKTCKVCFRWKILWTFSSQYFKIE